MKENSMYRSFVSVLFILLAGVAMLGSSAGPVMGATTDLSKYYKSPQMADAMNYVRQHKGEGPRRALLGSETELMDMLVKAFTEANLYTVTREPHAVFATTTSSLAFAFYFYPTQTVKQTEVETLLACPSFDAEQIRQFQTSSFQDYFFLNYINLRLLEKEYDPNIKEGSLLALSSAAYFENLEIASKLIKKGAKVDLAINELKELASKQLPYLDKPANKKAYDKTNAAIKLLEAGIDNLLNVKKAELEKENNAFQVVVSNFQKATAKPQFPEEARRYKVQAEGAVRDKDFKDAVDLYAQALQIAPWWPEGHYSRALVLEETKEYDAAIIEMTRYLALVPKAQNARDAQDKIYDWERKAAKMH